MSVRTVIIWRLDCSWRICFQNGYWKEASVFYWLLARGFSSSSRESLLRAALLVSSWHGGWLPITRDPREKGWSYSILCDSTLEVTGCYFCGILLIKQNSRKVGRALEANYHTYIFCCSCKWDFFNIIFLNWPALVYGTTIDFCMLILNNSLLNSYYFQSFIDYLSFPI